MTARPRQFLLLFLPLLALLVSCSRWHSQSIEYINYRITDSLRKDDGVNAMLEPYGDSLEKTMNLVIGSFGTDLHKRQPEGTLGNMMADVMLWKARQLYGDVDAAVMNYGGIRLQEIPAGPVSVGRIYELMPFDNLVVVQTVSGKVLQRFLDHLAAAGGWPVAGITMQIRDRKAVNVQIGGKSLDPVADYIIANSDYIANGGDNADMLRDIPQRSNGYLFRDALIDFITMHRDSGKEIKYAAENRVSHVQ